MAKPAFLSTRRFGALLAPLAAAGVILISAGAATAAAVPDASVVVTGPAAQGSTGTALIDAVINKIFFVTPTSAGTFSVSISGTTITVTGPAGGTLNVTRGATTVTATIPTTLTTTTRLSVTQFPN